MRCHYETLGIERDASASDIKKAYRKLALKWHPDKNLDNQEATAIFQEITSAHEVLSDPAERRWYDEHREQILRGQSVGGGEADGDAFVVNLWPYFSSSCFRGFDDDPRGFFAVYDGVFGRIQDSERAAAFDSGKGIDWEDAPRFGTSSSSHAEVREFYAHWSNFTSAMLFSWEDVYDEREAPNRFVRRKMEQENRKARSSARRKFQDQVRQLVAYAKRRDRRVLLADKERQEEKLRKQRQLEEAKKAKAAERKAAREEYWREQQELWDAQEPLDDADEQRAFRLADEGDSATEMPIDDAEAHEATPVVFYCELCDKTFKSEKALRNHEKSKAHRKALKSYLKQEGITEAEYAALLEEQRCATEESEAKGAERAGEEKERSEGGTALEEEEQRSVEEADSGDSTGDAAAEWAVDQGAEAAAADDPVPKASASPRTEGKLDRTAASKGRSEHGRGSEDSSEDSSDESSDDDERVYSAFLNRSRYQAAFGGDSSGDSDCDGSAASSLADGR